MDLARYVAERIRQLRTTHGGKGLSQEALADELKTTANTISRWETGTYRPQIEDLDQLSRVFGVSMMEFFPKDEGQKDDRVAALLRAAKELPDEDIDELQKYAEYRRARAMLGRNSKKGR